MGRVVFASTGGAIYGEAQTIPATEDHPVAPEAPYGLSKFCAENYCALFTRLHGLSTVALRFGNVYGPRQDPLGEAGVIAIFCGRVVDGGRPVVFGDGLQTRDYVHVHDIVQRQPPGRGVGRGRGLQHRPRRGDHGASTSWRRWPPTPRTASSPDFQPERTGEVRHIALDASRARELGWAPDDVAEGSRDAGSIGSRLDLTGLRTPLGARPKHPARPRMPAHLPHFPQYVVVGGGLEHYS